MKSVDAIKDKNVLALIPDLLTKKSKNAQYADIWEFSLNVALRISDTLSIKFDDIDLDTRTLKISESKTGKQATIYLNDKAYSIVEKIRKDSPSDVYLFQSKKSRNRSNTEPKPLTRFAVSQQMQKISEVLDINIGTHSARKTRGYFLYKKTGDIARVMKMLRHSSALVTLAYIGITQEDIDTDFKDLVL